MKIDNQPAAGNLEEILQQTASLKSSFPYILGARPRYVPSDEINESYNFATQQADPQEAVRLFQRTLQYIHESQAPEEFLANAYAANTHVKIGSNQQILGNHKEAIFSLNEGVQIFLESGNYFEAELACKSLAQSHRANGTLEKYSNEVEGALAVSLETGDQQEQLRARLELGAINRIKGSHEEAMKHYSVAYDLQQGPVDYAAIRVEQHEVGFSADEKIGTDNIQQCVAVILYDPVTKKSALAHVDRFTDTTSLAEVITKFPLNAKLSAHLVGGRDRSLQSKAVSDDNIARVMLELAKHEGVDIKSADIGDKGAPSGIIFDPKTGKISHGVPGKCDKTTPARKLMHDLKPQLKFAFDFTESPIIKDREFTEQEKMSLVWKYLNTSKASSGNATETWNANVIFEPQAKMAEKFMAENNGALGKAVLKFMQKENDKKDHSENIGSKHSNKAGLGFFDRIKKFFVKVFKIRVPDGQEIVALPKPAYRESLKTTKAAAETLKTTASTGKKVAQNNHLTQTTEFVTQFRSLSNSTGAVSIPPPPNAVNKKQSKQTER